VGACLVVAPRPVDTRASPQIADIVLYGLAVGMQVAEVAPSERSVTDDDEDDGAATRAAYPRAATRLVNEYGYREHRSIASRPSCA
jgi:hypothetical protein